MYKLILLFVVLYVTDKCNSQTCDIQKSMKCLMKNNKPIAFTRANLCNNKDITDCEIQAGCGKATGFVKTLCNQPTCNLTQGAACSQVFTEELTFLALASSPANNAFLSCMVATNCMNTNGPKVKPCISLN